VSPLIKITGNSQTFERMRFDMDFNAGLVLTGELSLEEAGTRLLSLIASVAAGAQSAPERLGHREYFVTYKHQATPSLEAGCHA
jgi:altronate dehydratase large subunit